MSLLHSLLLVPRILVFRAVEDAYGRSLRIELEK
jgi:hypothetical protein